jgi:hypothetical protein
MSPEVRQTFDCDRVSATSPAATKDADPSGPRPLAGRVGSVSSPAPAPSEGGGGGKDPEGERPMSRPSPAEVTASWQELEAQADRPQVQEVIRHGIRHGLIRVTAKTGGGIRFLVRKRPCPSPISNQD